MEFTYKIKDGYHCSSVVMKKDKIEITIDKDDSMEITEEEMQVIKEKFTELNNQLNYINSNIDTLLGRATIKLCSNIK